MYKSNSWLQLTLFVVYRVKQIFFYGLRGGNTYFLRRMHGVWCYDWERIDLFLPNDWKYWRICRIVAEIELQRTSFSWHPLQIGTNLGIYLYLHDCNGRATCHRSFSTIKSVFSFVYAFLYSSVVFHYRTVAILNSISLYIFPMNNIDGVSRSRRLHESRLK